MDKLAHLLQEDSAGAGAKKAGMSRKKKACPYCGESIQAIAIRCKHCQADLTRAPSPSPASSAPAAVPGLVVIEDGQVLDLLSALVEKSLVVYDEDENGQSRYRLLETVRQYAWERLGETEGGSPFRTQHQEFFVALAEEAEPRLVGPEQAAWLHRLEREHDNLRAALEWGLEEGKREEGKRKREKGGKESGEAARGDQSEIGNRKSEIAEAALRIAGSLWRFWLVRGYFSEGRERLIGVLAGADAQAYPHARAKAIRGAGTLTRSQGDYAAAQTLYQECLALYQDLGDKQGIAYSLQGLGNVAFSQGDSAAARTLYEEGLALQRELGDKAGIAGSLNNLGNVAHEQGDYAPACTLYEESLALQRALGDKQGIGIALTNLGLIAHEQGDYVTARTLYEEGLAILRELGDKRGIAWSLEAFAVLASVQEPSKRALRLWGAAKALREEVGAPLSPPERPGYDRQVARARAALSKDVFAAAWSEGRAMTLEQAIAYALQDNLEEDQPTGQ
jgi:tetratricopeptide (TPR) repeat protein